MRQKGFTIVELSLVIAIIAILAVISYVTYSGIQSRSRDSVRRDASKKLVEAYTTWMAENKKGALAVGGGWSDGGSGFIQLQDSSYYAGPTTIDILTQAGLLSSGFTDSLPDYDVYGNSGKYTFMLAAGCKNPQSTMLVWHLENPSDEDIRVTNEEIAKCNTSLTQIPYSTYKMNVGKTLVF